MSPPHGKDNSSVALFVCTWLGVCVVMWLLGIAVQQLTTIANNTTTYEVSAVLCSTLKRMYMVLSVTTRE